MKTIRIGRTPQLVDQRRPLRPVSVAVSPRPIKITKPISLGGVLPAVPAGRARR